MTETSRENLLIFSGETDLTFLELKTWRSFLHCIVGANQAYCNQLHEASEVLKMFADFCDIYNTGTGNNSKIAATKISTILDKTAMFHRHTFGDLDKYTDPDGAFALLLGCNDHPFEDLKTKAMECFENHQSLEARSETAWKSYLKLVKRLTDLEVYLSERLSPEELKTSGTVVLLEQRLGTALDHYHTCYREEVQHRDVLAQETQQLRKMFVKDEEEKFSLLFTFINETLIKLKKLTPQGLAVEKSVDFAAERPRIRDMASNSWRTYLTQHCFPDKKGNQESFNMDDLDDDSDSYDEGPKMLSFHRKCRIGSLKMPKTTHEDGIVNDIIDDILASLDAKLASEQNVPGAPQSAGDSCQTARACCSDIKLKLLELKAAEDDGKSVELSASENCPGSKYETAESVSAPELKFREEKGPPVVPAGSHRSNVSVYALTCWKRLSADQISIRNGMKLRQLRGADDRGMAYGYKRTRLGVKKYGFYPAELVSLSFVDVVRESRSSV